MAKGDLLSARKRVVGRSPPGAGGSRETFSQPRPNWISYQLSDRNHKGRFPGTWLRKWPCLFLADSRYLLSPTSMTMQEMLSREP
jgi:hypothetical protein